MPESKSASDQKNSPTIKVAGKTVVSFHYRMSEVDAEGKPSDWLEDSFAGDPLHYLHGFGNIITGVESALEGKSVGDKTAVTLDPISAYGPVKENAIQRVPVKHLQFSKSTRKILPGMIAGVKTEKGMRNVVVVKAGKFSADVDFNHPLAGKTLHYELEVMSVREASAEEVAHRHVHGQGGHQH